LKKEIELLFKKLCYNLDSLSNLNFTPKPYLNEKANIVSNVASIQREEKIPIFVSNAQLKAP
jgi:U3 small nucleolar RNA-associated protein MPP10